MPNTTRSQRTGANPLSLGIPCWLRCPHTSPPDAASLRDEGRAPPAWASVFEPSVHTGVKAAVRVYFGGVPVHQPFVSLGVHFGAWVSVLGTFLALCPCALWARSLRSWLALGSLSCAGGLLSMCLRTYHQGGEREGPGETRVDGSCWRQRPRGRGGWGWGGKDRGKFADRILHTPLPRKRHNVPWGRYWTPAGRPQNQRRSPADCVSENTT